MATPNIVPRADSEGGLGTASKYWASAYIDTIITTGSIGIGATPSDFNADADDLVVGAGSGNTGITIHSGTAGYGSIFFADGTADDATEKRGQIRYLQGTERMDFHTDAVSTAALSLAASGAATFTGEELKITNGNSEKPLLHLKATNNGTAGPHIKFEVDRGAAPAVGDDLGTILWAGEDSNQNPHHYAKILGEILNPASTDEAGRLTLFVGESDGTTADLSPGLKLEGSSSVDGEVNVTIGNASTSTVTIPGTLNGIPFYSDTTHLSMYTHDVSGNVGYSSAAYNTAYGFTAMDAITTGDYNTAFGYGAGGAISTGISNTAIGYSALASEDAGNKNVAIGVNALNALNNDGDTFNTAVGADAGKVISTGTENTLIGGLAGDALTIGKHNVAVGYESLSSADAGDFSVAIGHSALREQNGASAGDNFYNTAVGYQAGKAVTTGTKNTSIGARTMQATTVGQENVALGYQAMYTNVDGSKCVAIGANALLTQDPASAVDMYNVAMGYNAGYAVTTGVDNTIVGGQAGDALTTGSYNVAIGKGALSSEDTGGTNVAIGYNALTVQDAGSNAYNVAIGFDTGKAVTTGLYNTIVGGEALSTNIDGDNNTAIGYQALKDFEADTDGHGDNTAIGFGAMRDATTGANNTAVGSLALGDGILTGDYNVALGYKSGEDLTSGAGNTASGSFSLMNLLTGASNVAIGYGAMSNADDAESKNVAVGYNALNEMNNSTDNYNTAVGYEAGKKVSTGVQNTIVGAQAGDALTTGSYNTVFGYEALTTEDSHNGNTAIGYQTLRVQDAGANAYNTAVGHQAGVAVTTGIQNTLIGGLAGDGLILDHGNVVVGYDSLSATNAGSHNTAIGKGTLTAQQAVTQVTGGAYNNGTTVTHDSSSRPQVGQLVTSSAAGIPSGTTITSVTDSTHFELSASTTGGSITGATITLAGNIESYNTAVGFQAGNDITTGINNTIIGGLAGDVATTGNLNTLIGYDAGGATTTGGNNTAIGGGALDDLTEGVNNVALGQGAGNTVTAGNNNIYLGRQAVASSSNVNGEIVIGEGLTGLGAGTTRIGGNIQISDLTPTFSAITDSSITLVSGTEYLVNDANGGAMVLPSAGQGKRIIINIGTKITSNTLTITAASGDLLKGFAFLEATDAANNKTMFAPDGTDDLIITLDGSTKGGLVGDKIECVGISTTEWRVRAILQHTGTAATPFS